MVLGLAASSQAQIKLTESEKWKLYITVNTVGTAQALNHRNAFTPQRAELAKVSPGFQNAFGDLGFIGKFGKFGKNEEITVVMDLYLSSRNHPSQTYGNEGYILLRGVPENLESLTFRKPILSKVDIKAGHMLVDFGDAANHRSNNAVVQKNPLIGNFVVDPNIVSVGMQVSGKPGKYGLAPRRVERHHHGRLKRRPRLRLQRRALRVPHRRPAHLGLLHRSRQSDNPNKSGGASQLQMFTGNRSGERYAGVLGGAGQRLPTGAGR